MSFSYNPNYIYGLCIGMRIIFDPIVVNPDGVSIAKKDDYTAPLLYLDRAKLTRRGIAQAIEYANVDETVENLMKLKDWNALGPYITKSARDDYDAKVLAFAHRHQFEGRMRHFLQSRLAHIGEHPEAIIARAKRVAIRQEYPAVRRKLDVAIDKLPEHLKTLLKSEDEKITVVCAEHFVSEGNVCSGMACQDKANTIVALNEYVARLSVKQITNGVKEELWHYFSLKVGIVQDKDFIALAESILGDSVKMQRIEEKCHHIHRHAKVPISAYPVEQRPGELFVEYFHIRDSLLEKTRQGLPESRALSSSVAKIDAQMRDLFGNAFHERCLQFEADLIRRSKGHSSGAYRG